MAAVSKKISSFFACFVRGDMRKTLLVDRKLQPYLVKVALMFTLMTAALIELGHLFFFWSFKNQAQKMGFSPNHLFFKFLEDQNTRMLWVTLVLVFLIMILSGLIVLNLSNRIAGPIYHLREHLKALSTGKKPGELKFREDDFFQDIPALVNQIQK